MAPFIKHVALAKLLSATSKDVDVRCVTRWHPHEIAAGVSDLEIWSLIKERSAGTLWLRQDLHAKYYRIDDQCLIGSANLTLGALGWRRPSNLELLLPFKYQEPKLQLFEEELFSSAVVVNEGIYGQIEAAAKCLSADVARSYFEPKELLTSQIEDSDLSDHISRETWLPKLRHPEDLHKAYLGEWARLSSASQATAALDLQFLMIPVGLDKIAFHKYVGAMLLQQPLAQKVDSFVASPQRFGAVKRLLGHYKGSEPDFDAGQAWQTLMRWLLYFLPNRYELTVPSHSEVFGRRE